MPRPRRSRRRKQQQAVSPLRLRGAQKLAPPRALSAQQVAHCGVLVWGKQGQTLPAFDKLPVTYGQLSLPYVCTLIWTPGMKVGREAVMKGFTRLLSSQDTNHAWEMLAMLVDRNLLASAAGSEGERARTLKEVGDLRLPVYDVRLLWIRRTAATQRLITRWAGEVNTGANERHAFLRALYKERAMLCTLPAGWHATP